MSKEQLPDLDAALERLTAVRQELEAVFGRARHFIAANGCWQVATYGADQTVRYLTVVAFELRDDGVIRAAITAARYEMAFSALVDPCGTFFTWDGRTYPDEQSWAAAIRARRQLADAPVATAH